MEGFFETEILISPDEVSEDPAELFNPVESETVYTPILTQDESDSILVSDPDRVSSTVPDAISLTENDSEVISSGVVPDGSGSGGADPLQQETDGTITETLDNIYKVLEERLPEKESESESELESEDLETVQESEKSLTEIYDEIHSIKVIESEQLDELHSITDNNIISSNNVYHLASFEIALTSAIFGSILIGLLFRKIS